MTWEQIRPWFGDFLLALQVAVLGYQVWALVTQRRMSKQARASIAVSSRRMDTAIAEVNAHRDRTMAIAAQLTAKLHALSWGENDLDLGPPSRPN